MFHVKHWGERATFGTQIIKFESGVLFFPSGLALR